MTHRFKISDYQGMKYFYSTSGVRIKKTSIVGEVVDVGATWVDMKIFGEMITRVNSTFETIGYYDEEENEIVEDIITPLHSFISIEFRKDHPFSTLEKGITYEIHANGSVSNKSRSDDNS